MRIAVDMRMAGTGEGIARYVESLVRSLMALDDKNEYFLLFDKRSAAFADFPVTRPNFRKIKTSAFYYSWGEQTKFIWELKRLAPDLVHFASFNAPVFYPGRFIVTIHDLIHHQYPGKKKLRAFQRLAYRFAIWAAVHRADVVIAVSEGTKREIVKMFDVSLEKIRVVHEGVAEHFLTPAPAAAVDAVKAKYGIHKPYLLSVGVWRQYKNLPRLAQAFDVLKEQYHQDLQLVLAGKADPFYPEVKRQVLAARNAYDIRATGFVPDGDLKALYQGAEILVCPSLVEGFGLIGVEAQALGTVVAASDIPVLREVLGEGAAFFDPYAVNEMASVLHELLRDKVSAGKFRELGKANAQRYDWRKTAEQTLKIYESVPR